MTFTEWVVAVAAILIGLALFLIDRAAGDLERHFEREKRK